MKKEHYGAIDGLRAFACIGIIMMHMATSNSYAISGFVYERMVPSFTHFVYLFMVVSAFGMCCGYYEKVINNKIAFTEFYGKRYKKILPFFAVLVLLDVITSPSIDVLYQAFADITLLFGFLPGAGNITVIGVGWFLGLIFVFYICFPFFCVLIQNRKRAWLTFAVSLIYNFVCGNYFNVGRTNILYSGCFFVAGGLIYLYRREIAKISRWIGLGLVAVSAILYYIVRGNTLMRLFVSASLLAYSVMCAGAAKKSIILENKLTKFISGISLEIYLAHMFVFRVIERIGLNKAIGTGWPQYFITVLIVLIGAAIFAVVMKKIIKIVGDRIEMMVCSQS